MHAFVVSIPCYTLHGVQLVLFLALVLYLAFPPHPTPSFNKAGLLDWVHTCHLVSHAAGWVGPLPHLSSYISRVWHAPHSLAHPLLYRVCCCYPYHYILWGVLLLSLSLHFVGCVAAILIITFRGVCCCYPYHYIVWGVLLPPLVLHLQGVLLPPLVLHFAGCVAATLSITFCGVCCCHP